PANVSDTAVDITTLTGTAASTVVNVTGSKNVTLGATTAKEVNASNLSGALAITLGADLLKATGGTGNDVFTLNGAQNYVIDGGAGANQLVGGAIDLKANTLNISNIGAVQLTGAATFDAAQLSGKSYVVYGNDFNVIQQTGSSLDLSSLQGDAAVTITSTIAA